MEHLLVLFDADYADDAVWSQQGDLEVPGGRLVADALVRQLIEAGARCSDVCQRSFYGWEFEVDIGSTRALIVVQDLEVWVLNISLKQSISSLVGKVIGTFDPQVQLRTLVAEIAAALAKDEHLHNIRVMTESEFEQYSKLRNDR